VDDCGTFALSMNLGTIMCVASVVGASATVGIIPLIASFSDTVDHVGLGFSLKRRFQQTLSKMPYVDGNTIKTKDVTALGSLYFELGLAIPTDFIKISEKLDIGNYIGISANVRIMIDLGDIETVISGIIDELKHVSKSTAKNIVSKAMGLGRELSLKIDGTLTINLEELTHGLLCDFEFTLLQRSVLLTRGESNTGLPAGFYFSQGSDVVSDMINSVQGIFDNFSSIIEKLGIPSIKVPPIGIWLSFFINTTAVGFRVEFLSITASCMLKFEGWEFSCQINAKIFTMIADATKYVFKAGLCCSWLGPLEERRGS
jgi:hypothetical protein